MNRPEDQPNSDPVVEGVKIRVQRFPLEVLLREVEEEQQNGALGYTRYSQDDLNQLINKINSPQDDATN